MMHDAAKRKGIKRAESPAVIGKAIMAQLNINESLEQAALHHRAGRQREAEQLCRQILSQHPNEYRAANRLGMLALQSGRLDEGIRFFEQTVTLAPDFAEGRINLGMAFHMQRRFDRAIVAFRKAIELKPDSAEAYNNLANAQGESGQPDDAIDAYRRAVAIRPNFPSAWYGLGMALDQLKRFDEAVAAYQQAAAVKPDFVLAMTNLGNALRNCGKFDEAIVAHRRAIALQPSNPGPHNNYGIVLRDKGMLDAAVTAFETAIRLRPDFAESHANLGIVLADKGQIDAAIAASRRAIALDDKSPMAWNNLGNALRETGIIEESITAYRTAVALDPEYIDAVDNLLLAHYFHPTIDSREIIDAHRDWDARFAQPLKTQIKPLVIDRDPERRLRIGYISPDFADHPIGRFILSLFENVDGQNFELFAYSDTPGADAVTRRLRDCAFAWRDTVGISDANAAALVREDRIDILIDLTLHAANNRLLLFARKPAPVQATYLAYVGTSGLQTMDYRVSDPWLDPPGGDETAYTEKTIRLPRTYWCYAPPAAGPVRPPPVLDKGYMTFGCLNNISKVNQPLLALWAAILTSVPDSRLLLHANPGTHRNRMTQFLQSHGVEPHRVNFVGRVQPEEYFKLYHSIDVALDTLPYAGGTTTCDALWMGVPVITRPGALAVGRGGLSILSNLGLMECVANTASAYVQLAVLLARDVPRLTSLRAGLRSRMETSPLLDAKTFARNMEEAYRSMWRARCEQADNQ